VFSFPLNPQTLRLGAPTSATWTANRDDSEGYTNPLPLTLAPTSDGRDLFLVAQGPALHHYRLRSDGDVDDRERTCLGHAPGCRPVRGLVTLESSRREPIMLTRDGRYVYVLGRSATVFRRSR
jgi:hypothetical protein